MKILVTAILFFSSSIAMSAENPTPWHCGFLSHSSTNHLSKAVYSLGYWDSSLNLVLFTNDEKFREDLDNLTYKDVCVRGKSGKDPRIFEVDEVRAATQADY
jgi:hypothetical protein